MGSLSRNAFDETKVPRFARNDKLGCIEEIWCMTRELFDPQ